MKRHQVLTGSANPGKYCYSVGSVKDVVFWAYGSGCDLIISDTKHEPIQIISSNNEVITALDCCDYSGKIVVAYHSSLAIYTPSVRFINNGDERQFTWQLESTHLPNNLADSIQIVSWDDSGQYILMGAAHIFLWKYSSASSTTVDNFEWTMIWRSRMPECSSQLTFSPCYSYNGYFASIGKTSKMVKVWHRRYFSNESMAELAPKVDFSFIYLKHPDVVTSFEWRRNMILNKQEVFANVLVSSCKDQICRVWCENLEPKSSKIHHSYLPQSGSSQGNNMDTNMKNNPLYFNRDYLKYDRQFYLCATINPFSDIPLLSSIVSKNKTCKEDDSIFTVHFLNNKYFEAKVQKSR